MEQLRIELRTELRKGLESFHIQMVKMFEEMFEKKNGEQINEPVVNMQVNSQSEQNQPMVTTVKSSSLPYSSTLTKLNFENPYFPLNPFPEISISNMLISEEFIESKMDELPSKMAIGCSVDSFTLKNVQPILVGYRFEYIMGIHDGNLDRFSFLRIVDDCEKLERVYSMVFIEKLVVVNDPYKFRLLVMGNRRHDVDVRLVNNVAKVLSGFSMFVGDFLLNDFAKFDHPLLLHRVFQVLNKFISEFSCFHVIRLEKDAQKLAFIAANISEWLGEEKVKRTIVVGNLLEQDKPDQGYDVAKGICVEMVELGFAKGLSNSLLKSVKYEDVFGLYKCIISLQDQQIPYTMMKFDSFETIVAMTYKYGISPSKDQCSKFLQLGVRFTDGYVQVWQGEAFVSFEVLTSRLKKAWLSFHIRETMAQVFSIALVSRKYELSSHSATIVIDLILAERQPKGNGLFSFQDSSSQDSCNQQLDILHNSMGKGLLQELSVLLQKCRYQQTKFPKEAQDVQPGVSSCIKSEGDKVLIQEPMVCFLPCVFWILLLQTYDKIDQLSKFIGKCFRFFLSQENKNDRNLYSDGSFHVTAQDVLTGYQLGGPSMVFFSQVGEGIHTEATAVSKLAGTTTDLIGSYTESSYATLIVASIPHFGIDPCLITTLIAIDFFEIKTVKEIEPLVKRQLAAMYCIAVAILGILSTIATGLAFHNAASNIIFVIGLVCNSYNKISKLSSMRTRMI